MHTTGQRQTATDLLATLSETAIRFTSKDHIRGFLKPFSTNIVLSCASKLKVQWNSDASWRGRQKPAPLRVQLWHNLQAKALDAVKKIEPYDMRELY